MSLFDELGLWLEGLHDSSHVSSLIHMGEGPHLPDEGLDDRETHDAEVSHCEDSRHDIPTVPSLCGTWFLKSHGNCLGNTVWTLRCFWWPITLIVDRVLFIAPSWHGHCILQQCIKCRNRCAPSMDDGEGGQSLFVPSIEQSMRKYQHNNEFV